MKLILFLLFFFGFVNCFAQSTDFVTEQNYVYQNEYKYCDYKLKVGKPVFLVVYLNHGIPNDSLLALRELKELKHNFKNQDANFINVFKNGIIEFDTSEKTKIDFTDFNTQVEKVLYWDGKKSSKILENDKIINSSEFFSKDSLLQSSYVNDFYLKKDSLNNLKQWKPNEKSAELSNLFLKNFF